MRRLRYRRELTEIEILDARSLPAEHGSWVLPDARAASALEWLGRSVLFIVRALAITLGVTARIAWPIAVELVCIAITASCCTADLVGRGLGYVGRAAARRSWIIAASRDALAKLPPPRRVERTAIAVRRLDP
jgi:hypothetical protein